MRLSAIKDLYGHGGYEGHLECDTLVCVLTNDDKTDILCTKSFLS